eukprot:Skav227499  [mRNA]  locus=scaffold282:174451:175605:+ [translate_table: standard]
MAAPRQLATKEETFAALAAQFNFSERVRDKIIDCGCETLSDFTYMVNSEDEVKTVFIDTLANLDGPRIQAARLRHAWVACKALMESLKSSKAQAVVVEDEESLLPQDELLDLKAMWFRRYHLKPEPGCMPSDRLISKVVRSLRKHTLEVMDLWSVRSLTHQRIHGQKRRRIADGLFVQEVDDTEDAGVKNWAAYLKKLDIYLCALSIAGCRPVDPAPVSPETAASESTEYVLIPYDLLLRYRTRAEDLASRISDSQKLRVVSQLDVQERGEWSARFGGGGRTLGSVIFAVMRDRDALWIGASPVADLGGSAPSSSVAAPSASPGVSLSLRDGTKLCDAFQKGKCPHSGKSCPSGAHRCGKVKGSGRPCGSFAHGASSCDNKKLR